MRIALFGPPGAGKGTQATIVEHRFGFKSISTGAIIRTAMREQTELGLQAQAFVDAGRLVPDDLVSRLAQEAVADCAFDGFILDGYPRTLVQARSLDAFLELHQAPLDALVSLEVDDEDIVDRLSGRRMHADTGATYHLVHNPPPPGIAADRLVQRSDDRPGAIRHRLDEYRTLTEPVLRYFAAQDRLVCLDGSGSVADVARRLTTVLVGLAQPV